METYTVKIPYDIVRVHNDGIPEVSSPHMWGCSLYRGVNRTEMVFPHTCGVFRGVFRKGYSKSRA